ncbi:MAG: MFS transporter, partial [Gammaproteobacteria bacterium]|nr:MFS transporter [Gammaproteobacteria bacterium]
RLMQGIFMGASAVVIRSIFADILPADRLLRMGTMLGTMWGVGPVIGPIVGSYLQVHIGWQANFSLFALLTFIEFLAVFFIVPETLRVRQSLCFASLKHNFMEVISNRFFVALSVMMGIVYSLIISFNTMGPFLIEEQFGYTPIFFGRLALGLGAMFLGATFVCRYFLKKNTFKRLVFIVTHFALFVAMTGLFITFSASHSVVLITLVSAVMYFTCGFIFPLSMGRGMSMFRHMAGTASATMYFINVLLTSSINFLVSFIHAETMQTLFMIYVGLLLVCIFIYWMIIRPCVAKQ